MDAPTLNQVCMPSRGTPLGYVASGGLNQTLFLSNFSASLDNLKPCGVPTYLRPDPGGALLPWPYTMAWMLIHFPLTVLRVTRWEKVQTLSIVLACFSVYFTIQAFTTNLDPDQVMVWMPIAIVSDIGAMMQLVFLVVEENGATLLRSALKQSITRPFSRQYIDWMGRKEQTTDGSKTTSVRVISLGPQPVPVDRGLIGQAWLTVLALVLLCTLLALQLVGLGAASQGREIKDLQAIWCSPMFRGAESVIVKCGEAPVFVDKTMSQGIGCVGLAAHDQEHWLTATVAILSVSLVFEFLDGVILVTVGNNRRWWGASVKRPWLSMLAGNAVLLCILISSINSSSNLPNTVDRTVWVFRYDQSVQSASVCQGALISSGVRGSIIGWTDGFLESWGKTYQGH